jgi:hypothetical protein
MNNERREKLARVKSRLLTIANSMEDLATRESVGEIVPGAKLYLDWKLTLLDLVNDVERYALEEVPLIPRYALKRVAERLWEIWRVESENFNEKWHEHYDNIVADLVTATK